MNNPDLSLKSVILNSSKRSFGTISNSENILENPIQGIKSMKVSKLLFPNSIPNISSRNNKMFLSITSATLTSTFDITLDNYNYNGGFLADNIKSKLNSHTSSNLAWECTYQTASNTLCISNTSANFLFSSGTLIGSTAPAHAYFETGLVGKCNTFGNSLTSNSIDLSGIKLLNIQSNIGSVKSNKIYNNILDSIPITSSWPQLNLWQNDSSDYVNIDLSDADRIDIKLLDNYYREIDLQNDYSIQLNFLTD